MSFIQWYLAVCGVLMAGAYAQMYMISDEELIEYLQLEGEADDQ